MTVIKSEYLLPNYDPEEVGMKGEKGDDGKTSYVHIAYSNSSDGGVDFSTTDPTNRAYTGYYTDFEMIDSTDPSKYTWQRTKGEDGADGQLFTGETEPTNFNEGDIWYKVISGNVTGVYEAKGGTWIEIPFESSVIAETIIGKTIQASHLTGSTIDGGSISGAEFTNQFDNVTSGVNQVTDGVLKIENGILQAGASYYLTDAAGTRLYKFATTEADIHQGSVNLTQKLYNDTGVQTSHSTASISGGLITLSLSDASGNYMGVLNAKALTRTPWINLQMGSLWEAAENNPPQYRIIYNLDGSRTIAFKGQVKLKSGTMSPGNTYLPFSQSNSGGPHYLPDNIKPQATVFAFAPVGVPAGTTSIMGQWGITSTGYWKLEVGQATVYASLSSISYDLV